ncbi:hypothetical protein [Nonomuraea rubra]
MFERRGHAARRTAGRHASRGGSASSADTDYTITSEDVRTAGTNISGR